MFPNLVIEFYSNLTIEGSSIKSIVKGIEIDIHRDQFKRIFELLFQGVSYTYEGPIKFNKFKLSTNIISFVMNPMEDMKLPIKLSHLKEKICVTHYLITRILLPRQTNLDVVIKEDVSYGSY